MTVRINIIGLLVLLITVNCQADIASANAARSRGDYDTAIAEYQRLADAGNDVAQATLGYLYYVGEGVEQDLPFALDLYARAADQGNPDAQYNLAVAYAFGEGVAQDFSLAVQWYTRAAEQDHAIAQYSLGLSYANGEGVSRNPETAASWFARAAENGYARAQVLLGSKYHTGDDVALDLAEAARWYRLAADQGDAIAQFNLASMYRSGSGVDQDLDEALRLYQMAAAQGYNAAGEELANTQEMLASTADATHTDATVSKSAPLVDETSGLMSMDNLYPSLPDTAVIDDEDTVTISPDIDNERPEVQTASVEASTKEVSAGFFSRLFTDGDDSPDNTSEAGISVPGTDSDSQEEATVADTESGMQDHVTTTAIPDSMISVPTKADVAETEFNSLSSLYRAGMDQLAQQDYTGAVSLFRSAAARGEPMAQYQLGVLYQQGLGLDMDHDQAALWYRRAAEQGNVDAQFNLGNMYLMGDGIPQNDSDARYWYEQAATNGHADAAHNLKNMEQFAVLGNSENVIAPLQVTEFSDAIDDRLMNQEQSLPASATPAEGIPSSIAVVDYERGLAYAFGEGVPRDQSRAFDYFRRPAEQGHASAQYRLGIAYAYGDGTTQDKAQAMEWYRRAALQGHSIAQRNLAIMYQEGDGIPENKPLALAWLSILADNGNVMDQRRRDMLAVELNSDQLDMAEKIKSDLRAQIKPANN